VGLVELPFRNNNSAKQKIKIYEVHAISKAARRYVQAGCKTDKNLKK
jgi:hypothetical protein